MSSSDLPISIATTSSQVPAPKTKSYQKRHIHPIIEIAEASKYYGFVGRWHQGIRKFSMTVYDGEIFALLGPHGCGKTTVLNVILGFKDLNMGQVTVFGFKPGNELSGIPGKRVGYTPQSSGLCSEITIQETFRYYASLLNLDAEYAIRRIAFLCNLLALPDDSQYIHQCSEGNKRQVSFAVALLHEPELLVLDEPCAGLDPLLRRSMWEHMKELANENKTILITTQNCEEAKLADKVGFMRRGHLMAQGNPKELLKIYDEKLLESLYRKFYSSAYGNILTTSSLQANPLIKFEPLNTTASEGFMYTGGEEGTSIENFAPPTRFEKNIENSRSENRTCCCCPNCRKLFILIHRDILRSIRSYTWLTLYLILPPLFLIVFCYTIGTIPSSLHVAVVNNEATEENCLVTPKLFMSCQILSLIDRNIIKQVEYPTESEALKAAQNLDVHAILVINKHFTTHMTRALYDTLVIGKVENMDAQVPIILSLDVTSRIVANTIEGTIKIAIESYLQLATRNITSKSSGRKSNPLGYPLKVIEPIFGTKDTTDTEYMATGLVITYIYHSAAFLAAFTLVSDRVNKITQRDYLAGVYLEETVFSQMVVYGTISMVQALLLFVVLLGIMDMAHNGNLWNVAFIVLLQIWCGISFGTLIAMLSRRNIVAGLYVFGFLCGTLILCGIEWPLTGIPNGVRVVIEFLPQTKSIGAVRNILQKGLDIKQKHVWSGMVVPACWLFIFTLFYGFINIHA